MRRALLFASALVLPCFIRAESETDIQRRIDEAIKAGGGEIVIGAGVHTIEHGLKVKDARHLRIIAAAAGKTTLRLGPLAFAEASAAASPGEAEIKTARSQNLAAGMRLKIEADGEPDAFTHKPRPYQLALIKTVEPARLVLDAPLKFPVPAGTHLRHEDAPNLIEIRGASDDVRIEGLILEGGRTADAPPVRGHAQLCGIFASGAYSYEKGPTGPRVKGLRVTQCTIRNFFGRGVALYSVEGSAIEDCTISDTNDEAIDLDHFTVETTVRRNEVERSHVGVELNDASDCAVEGNTFRHCQTGLNLWRWCKQPGLNERNRISGNTFTDTAGNALQIATGTAENTLTGNTIAGAGKSGIVLSGSKQTVTGNRISGTKLKPIAVAEGEHTLQDNE